MRLSGSSIALIAMVACTAFFAMYSFQLHHNYNALSSRYAELEKSYDALSLDHTRLKNDYNALSLQFSDLQANYERLSGQYSLLQARLLFELVSKLFMSFLLYSLSWSFVSFSDGEWEFIRQHTSQPKK